MARLYLAVAFLGALAGELAAQGGRPVASVTVTPTPATVPVGGAITLTATAFDRSGRPLTGRAFNWSSSNTALATVSGGVVTGVAPGSVAITATTGGQNGTASVTVTPAVPRPGILPPSIGLPVVSLGMRHDCAIRSDGAAYCWGWNDAGDLGDGTTLDQRSPVPAASSLGRFQAIGVGATHTCGLLRTGLVDCWGDNRDQQLGSYAAAMSLSPVALSSLTFQSLSVGGNHACAVTGTGTAYCWGANNLGQLGNYSAASHAPVPVAGSIAFRSISAGGYHTCGVTRTDELYCWGWNDAGQIGTSTPSETCGYQPASGPTQPTYGLGSIPVTAHCIRRPALVVFMISDSLWQFRPPAFTSVAAGYAHTCVIEMRGGVWCWGRNDRGQLGSGAIGRGGDVVRVASLLQFAFISAGRDHTCALTSTGEAFCWGADSTGQLGRGPLPMGVEVCPTLPNGTSVGCYPDRTYSAVPVAVVGGLRFVSIKAGGNSTCGVTTAAAVFCWGEVAGSSEPVRLSWWP
jgi:alpha-tubulin suppressor-like RCC1 family protein